MIEEARARIAASPARYAGRIFGLEEAGGTSVLFISDVPAEVLGFPSGLPGEPLPTRTDKVLRKIPAFAVGASALLAGLYWIIERRTRLTMDHGGPKEGTGQDRTEPPCAG